MIYDTFILLTIWSIVSFFYFLYSLGTPYKKDSEINIIEVVILFPTLVAFFVIGWLQVRNIKQ
jgi:hypothetical protein